MTVVVGEAMAGMAMTAVPAGFAMPDGTGTAGGAARTGSDGGSEGTARASSGAPAMSPASPVAVQATGS